MAAPPLFAGAVKVTVACALPDVAVPMVGASGGLAGHEIFPAESIMTALVQVDNSSAPEQETPDAAIVKLPAQGVLPDEANSMAPVIPDIRLSMTPNSSPAMSSLLNLRIVNFPYSLK